MSDSIFQYVSDEHRLVLPTGEVLWDTAILPDFAEHFLGIDIGRVWQDLLALPTHPVDQDIAIGDGRDPKWIPGAHPALNYRGRAVKRDKIWAQSGYDAGLSRYGYTGWQWDVAGGTVRVDALPGLDAIATAVNATLGLEHPHNNWIVTRYGSGADNIGFHSDKTKDFRPGSCFVVIKCGQPRRFEFSWDEDAIVAARARVKQCEKAKEGVAEARAALRAATKGRQYPEVFFSRVLSAGTAVIVGTAANLRVKHGVPPIEGDAGENHVSGSIVGRCIDTVVDWDVVKKRRVGRPSE